MLIYRVKVWKDPEKTGIFRLSGDRGEIKDSDQMEL